MARLDLGDEGLRRPRRVMMHVVDAGNGPGSKVIRFACGRCDHDTDWIVDERTISENRRGMPCPKCNEPELASIPENTNGE